MHACVRVRACVCVRVSLVEESKNRSLTRPPAHARRHHHHLVSCRGADDVRDQVVGGGGGPLRHRLPRHRVPLLPRGMYKSLRQQTTDHQPLSLHHLGASPYSPHLPSALSPLSHDHRSSHPFTPPHPTPPHPGLPRHPQVGGAARGHLRPFRPPRGLHRARHRLQQRALLPPQLRGKLRLARALPAPDLRGGSTRPKRGCLSVCLSVECVGRRVDPFLSFFVYA